MTEQKEALKPRPFCGAAPMANGGPRRGAFGYLCAQTGHRLQTYGATRAEAITAWNTRSQPLVAVPVELVEMRGALSGLVAFVSVMVGVGPNCKIPETITTPLGIPVKIGAMMREARRLLLVAVRLAQHGAR